MFCQHCGSALPPGGATCARCGGATPAAAASAGAPAPYPPGAPPPYSAAAPCAPYAARRGSGVGIVVAVVVGVFALIVVAAIVAAIALPALTASQKARAPARSSAGATQCRQNVYQIGVYRNLYRERHQKAPAALRDLWGPGFASDPRILICPQTGPAASAPPPGGPWESVAPFVSYEYRSSDAFPGPGDLIILWDRTPHRDGQRCVLFADGRSEFVDELRFQELSKRR
jgi:hypothetical protein